MKRDISISTCFDYSIPIEEQISLIAEKGFNYVTLGSEINHSRLLERNERYKLKTLLKENSLRVDTIHGCSIDAPYSIEVLSLIAEAAFDLDVRTIVVHTSSSFYIDKYEIKEKLEKLLYVCERLILIADKYNVVFALENLHPDSATEVLRIALPKLDKRYFGFCYDSSHDQIDGPRPFTLLEEFKDRLMTIHLSDRVKDFVDHVIPGEGFIDFDSICRILKSIKYNRPILLELMMLHSKEKETNRFLELAYEAGCNLFDMIHKER